MYPYYHFEQEAEEDNKKPDTTFKVYARQSFKLLHRSYSNFLNLFLKQKEEYIAVMYTSPSHEFYIGRILDRNNHADTYRVKFLQKQNGESFWWPQNQQIEEVTSSQIFRGKLVPHLLPSASGFYFKNIKEVWATFHSQRSTFLKTVRHETVCYFEMISPSAES